MKAHRAKNTNSAHILSYTKIHLIQRKHYSFSQVNYLIEVLDPQHNPGVLFPDLLQEYYLLNDVFCIYILIAQAQTLHPTSARLQVYLLLHLERLERSCRYDPAICSQLVQEEYSTISCLLG